MMIARACAETLLPLFPQLSIGARSRITANSSRCDAETTRPRTTRCEVGAGFIPQRILCAPSIEAHRHHLSSRQKTGSDVFVERPHHEEATSGVGTPELRLRERSTNRPAITLGREARGCQLRA